MDQGVLETTVQPCHARSNRRFCLTKLSHLRQDRSFKVYFGAVGAVEVNADTVQGGFQGFLASGKQHFISDRGGIGDPGNEDKFGGGSAIGRGEFQINQGITAIVIGQIGAKVVVGFGAFAFTFNDNLFLVLDGVQNVAALDALAQLEFVEGGRNIVVNSHSSRLTNVRSREDMSISFRNFDGNHQLNKRV